ncbi:MAG TPA: hypothetical protein DD733_02980 [Clostridiales bacterium]|nr:hypothetical protein [Clostridiales bacterium]
MRVLQINSVCGFGSTGRIAVDLYNLLTSQNHDSIIAYGRRRAPDNVNSIRISYGLGVLAHTTFLNVTPLIKHIKKNNNFIHRIKIQSCI